MTGETIRRRSAGGRRGLAVAAVLGVARPSKRRTRPFVLRRAVKSASLRSLGYDADRGILEVEFVNGHVYEYLDVPRELYEELRAAPSKGRYFNDHIRDEFSVRQLH